MCSICSSLKQRRPANDEERSALLKELGTSGATRAHQDEVVGQILGMKSPERDVVEDDEFDSTGRSY